MSDEIDIIIAAAIGDHDYSTTAIGRCVCGVKTKDLPAHRSERVVAALAASGHTIVPTVLLSELVDPDSCWFDHNGGCQAHGHFPPDVDQAWTCPVESAKTVLAAAAAAEEDQ